jgi:hypothetical protein
VGELQISNVISSIKTNLLGLGLSALVLITTEFGFRGSIAILVLIQICFYLSKSILKFTLAFFTALSFYAITSTIFLFFVDAVVPSVLLLTYFCILFACLSIYIGRQKWDLFKIDTVESYLTLVPAAIFIVWFAWSMSKISDTTSARISWLVTQGEDNASWITGISSLSTLRSGGVEFGNNAGGGPLTMPIVSLADGFAAISGLSDKSDLAPLTLINLYGLIVVISLIAASLISLMIVKLSSSSRDLVLVFSSSFMSVMIAYLILGSFIEYAHLTAAMALCAFFGAAIASILSVKAKFSRLATRSVIGLLILLIAGIWYPLAPFVLIFFVFVMFDEFKAATADSKRMSLVLLSSFGLLIVSVTFSKTLFSLGDFTFFDYLSFAGGVTSLSSIGFILLIALMLFSLRFASVLADTSKSLYLTNILSSLVVYVAFVWLTSYLTPQGNPNYAAYKLSLFAFGAVATIALPYAISTIRKRICINRSFLAACSVVLILLGATTPEIFNLRFAQRYQEQRWAKPLAELVRQNPNSQIVCLSQEAFESYICTRFATAMTAANSKFSADWRSAVGGRVPDEDIDKLIVLPFNESQNDLEEKIAVLFLDDEVLVEARHPWVVRLEVD